MDLLCAWIEKSIPKVQLHYLLEFGQCPGVARFFQGTPLLEYRARSLKAAMSVHRIAASCLPPAHALLPLSEMQLLQICLIIGDATWPVSKGSLLVLSCCPRLVGCLPLAHCISSPHLLLCDFGFRQMSHCHPQPPIADFVCVCVVVVTAVPFSCKF